MTVVSRLILFLLLFSISATAQQITISGYVTEKQSGERLIGATVFVPEKNAGTATNAFGFYSITLPKDSFRVHATYLGFQPFIQTVAPITNLTLNIEMERQSNVQLSEVIVKATPDPIQQKTQMSTIDIPIETIKSLPSFLGEVDVLKAIQLLPGVQAGNEG